MVKCTRAEFSKWQKQTDFAFDPNSREAYLFSFCGDIQGHIVDIQIDTSLEHLKFIYSEKAKKFCEISTLLLSYVLSASQK